MSEPALTPFPLGFDPPGARRYRSTLQTRTAELLIDVLAEHQFRGASRYRPRDVDGDGTPETWCNVHTVDVAEAMGLLLPRGKRANELTMYLLQQSRDAASGWEQVNAHVAQACADVGQLAIACWFNPNGGPGHIAPLEPSMGELGVWCSNVGATNFLRGTVGQAFGSRAVTFFVHP